MRDAAYGVGEGSRIMEDQNENQTGWRFPWRLFCSELVGTALLVLVGLSLVILMFGADSTISRVVPREGLRRMITGEWQEWWVYWIGPVIGAIPAT
jgi:glycerol uptake facilitator-like aquaporin